MGKIFKRFLRPLIAASMVAGLLTVPTTLRVSAACTINGTIYRDFNATGTDNAGEPGVGAVTVTAYAPDGTVAATAPSAADGTYTLNVTSAVPQVRVEFTDIPAYLRSGPYGANSSTSVTFVDCAGGATVVDFGIANPGQYCHTDNPNVAVACFAVGDQFAPAAANVPVLIDFPYATSGSNVTAPPFAPYDQPAHGNLANAPQIGTTFGIAYQRSTDSYFVSSFVKRHAGLGPGSTPGSTTTGGIYRINNSTGAVSLFTNLQTTFATGADPHPGSVGYLVDENAFDAVGKVGLGGMDISEDDRTLYVVKIASPPAVISIPIASPGAATSRPITAPACAGGTFRPFGLTVKDQQVYIGGVCDAGTSQLATNLDAYVLRYTPSSGAMTTVFSMDMDYPRRCADQAPACPARPAAWRPWISTWTFPAAPTTKVYPQPMLTDLDFDNDDLILGFRDRFGDQTGSEQRSPNVADMTLYSSIAAGDVLRACDNGAGGWDLENNASCGGVTTIGNAGASVGQGPGGGEYYFTDNNVPNNTTTPIDRHDEITIGGLLQLPGSDDVLVSVYDPVPGVNQLFDGGFIWMNNQTGFRDRGYRVYNGDAVGGGGPPGLLLLGKANGLGSLVAECGPAPLEIGNRVWEDLDRNGRQDPGEQPLAGVIVSLYLGGARLATATTNAAGEYIFNEANVYVAGDTRTFLDINASGARDINEPAGILPDTTYSVQLDDPANYGGGVLTPYYATVVNAAAMGDTRDSDGAVTDPAAFASVTNIPTITVDTGTFGENDHTFDFGFSLTPPPVPTPVPPPPGGGTPGPAQNFTLTKAVDNPFAAFGSVVTWTITISNPNNVAISNVSITDNFPAELEIIPPVTDDSPTGTTTQNGQTVTFSQPVLAPGETVHITVRTRIIGNALVITNTVDGFCCGSSVTVASAQAQILRVTQLPATGESWFSRFYLPFLAIVVVLGSLLIVMGVRSYRARRNNQL